MIRVGIVGLGYRGMYLLKLLQSMSSYLEVVALADPSPEPDLRQGEWVLYDQGREDYKKMIDQEHLDLVIISSPWFCQVEHALYAVRSGCHIALEIKGGLGLGEYDELIRELSNRSLKAYPLENTIFRREVLALWNICQSGLLGEIVFLRGGYRHDLRAILLDKDGYISSKGEGKWRLEYYLNGQADIYPTHGLAPLALIGELRSGDEIEVIQSLSSSARGILERCNEATKELIRDKDLLGDIISTQIRTSRGIVIQLTHDTTLPRPRSLDWEVQGTKGLWRGDSRQIYVEGVSPYEQWEDDAQYIEEYEHRYWRLWGAEALEIDKHHVGMDYVMLRAMVDDLLGESCFPIEMADLSLWCSITPLTREVNPYNKGIIR